MISDWKLHLSWEELDFHGGSVGKESSCNAKDPSSVPGSGRSPGEGNGNPLQYAYLGNSMAASSWSCKSQTRLSNQTNQSTTGRKYKCIIDLWWRLCRFSSPECGDSFHWAGPCGDARSDASEVLKEILAPVGCAWVLHQSQVCHILHSSCPQEAVWFDVP